MRNSKYTLLVVCAGFCGCAVAVAVPRELVDAREAFDRANSGVATLMAPEKLRIACLALVQAEQSFRERPDSYITRDLAYIAERKSRAAEISASINIERGRQIGANNEYRSAVGGADKTVQSPVTSGTTLSQKGEMTPEPLSMVHADGTSMAQPFTVLAQTVELKQNTRGITIVLPASALFAPDQSTLLPEARSLLDPVIDVLLSILERERDLIVDGHTDSLGIDSDNVDFSQRRANAVRDYLVQRDYPSDRIHSRGLGEQYPIADNTSADGRMKNRRIEIFIKQEIHSPEAGAR
jgi:outer membrane protein OmpA-like peptidoglycan-associated protein